MLSTALILAAALAAAVLTPNMARAQAIDTLSLRAHTMVLAHDSLEGRGTGTRGEERAARYIVGQLQRLGISGAAPDGGYLQPVPLQEIVLDPTATRLIVEPIGRDQDPRGADDRHDAVRSTASPLVSRGGESSGSVARRGEFLASRHFIMAPSGAGAFRDFAGDALFAGTSGLASQALAGAGSLDGKVVVLLGTLGNSALKLIPELVRRGAAGVVLLIPDHDNFRGISRAYGPTRLGLTAQVDNPIWQPELPVLIGGPELTAALLAGLPLAPNALDGTRPFTAIPLAQRIDLMIHEERRELASANIAALIPGHDPVLRDEVVIYTAHYDHLGIGRADQHGDSIYNGFSDNAAGTAMLLAIAEAMREESHVRSILFLFFTGEERGLLGSTYYVSEPLVPLDRVAAVINLDAGAPAAPPRNWRIAGGKESTLGSLALRVAEYNGWTADLTDASANSDHWPFLHSGVPAIFLIPGQDWEGVTRQEKEALQHRWENYHQPADEWHPDFPFHGLQRYAEVALRIGREAANGERPRLLND
jgi:hypothetical protein